MGQQLPMIPRLFELAECRLLGNIAVLFKLGPTAGHAGGKPRSHN